jgi:exosortase K
VLFSAVSLKLYYSTASVNQLRWILAPTAALVELVTGSRFQFESHAGYISSDHSFIIAASCAGLNFLITAFLMLSLRKLWTARAHNSSRAWRFIPIAALSAYFATLVANTVRIATALRMQRFPIEIGLSANQLHRLEGILIYFGFLLLLFVVSEKLNLGSASNSGKASTKVSDLLRRSFFPLLIYYATTLAIPLVNGGYRQGPDFWEHSLFVLLTPLIIILPLVAILGPRASRPPSQ